MYVKVKNTGIGFIEPYDTNIFSIKSLFDEYWVLEDSKYSRYWLKQKEGTVVTEQEVLDAYAQWVIENPENEPVTIEDNPSQTDPSVAEFFVTLKKRESQQDSPFNAIKTASLLQKARDIIKQQRQEINNLQTQVSNLQTAGQTLNQKINDLESRVQALEGV